MADATRPLSPASRKIRWLGAAVVAFVVLYSASWFYVASKIEDRLNAFLMASGNGPSPTLACSDLKTGGFPFLIGFSCTKTAAVDKSGLEAEAGSLSAAARIYAPGLAITELKGPLSLTAPGRLQADADWKSLRASIHASFDGLQSLSLESTNPTAKIQALELPAPIQAAADDGQIHARRNNRSLDIALMAQKLRLTTDTGMALLPTLSTSLEATLDDQADMLSGKFPRQKAMSGTISSFKLESESGLYGELSGDFEIDEKGYLTGRFKTRLEDLSGWDKTLSRIFPDARDTISGVAALLKGLAKGKNKVTVTLEVNRGKIYLSMIPLGRIPPI